MTEPMGDADLDLLAAEIAVNQAEGYEPSCHMLKARWRAVLARIEADRETIASLAAARDAALARAMPEPVYVASAAVAEALPDGNYAYCFGSGRRLRGLATKRNRIWTFIGTDDECEPNSAEMVDTWISGPLPNLPIPTPRQEG